MATLTKEYRAGFLILLLALLMGLPAIAQEITDKQLGFDRAEAEKELSGGKAFIKKELLSKKVDEVRANMVKNYKKRQENILLKSLVPVPSSACYNMDFQNATAGWALYMSYDNYGVAPSVDPGASSQTGSLSLTNYDNRITVVPSNTIDNYISTTLPVKTGGSSGDKIIRLGEVRVAGEGQEEITKKFELTEANGVLQYSYAVVQNQPTGHPGIQPFFKVTVSISGPNSLPDCASIEYFANDAATNGFFPSPQGTPFYYKPWSTNIINLSEYVDFNINPNPIVTLSFSVSDCGAGGSAHETWAYVEAACLSSSDAINVNSSNLCKDTPIGFSAPGVETLPSDTKKWYIYSADNPEPIATYTGTTATHSFQYAGAYRIKYVVSRAGVCDFIYSRIVNIKNCNEECDYCASFNPQKGEKYIISGWVREKTTNNENVQAMNYDAPFIKVSYTDVSLNVIGTDEFRPAGDIIDGWQRIYGEFTIPGNIDDLHIDLENGGSPNVTYFDDIRVFPYNGSMKSFVYDPATQRLMAELDENNYATFYEYDSEGGLIRVKKETRSGVRTIEETRSANTKKQ